MGDTDLWEKRERKQIELISVQMEIWKEKNGRKNKLTKGPRVQGNISQQDLRKGLF